MPRGVVAVAAVGMDARVPRELVGAREPLLAARERAEERLLAGVRPDVAGLRDACQRRSGHPSYDDAARYSPGARAC